MKRILITSFGSNTSIGIAKCLKEHFIVGTDCNPHYLCSGYGFASVVEHLPYYNDSSYASCLVSLLEKYEIDCIIPVHDREIEVICSLKEQNKINNVEVVSNSSKVINLCNDKTEINQYLEDIVKVPKMYYDTANVEFPVIVKENKGVSSRDVFVANHLDELIGVDIHEFLIQEYVEGEEYTVDCYTSYIDSSIFYYSVRRRIETKSGMSTKSEIINLPVLGELCEKIHRRLNYKGVSNIQFIIRNNIPYFIEINPRFAGAGILTYKSGYNFPLFSVEELCNKNVCNNAILQIGNKMVRYYEETFFNEANDCIRL